MKKQSVKPNFYGITSNNKKSLYEYNVLVTDTIEKDFEGLEDEILCLFRYNEKFGFSAISDYDLNEAIKQNFNDSFKKMINCDLETFLKKSFVYKITEYVIYFGIFSIIEETSMNDDIERILIDYPYIFDN